MFPVEAKLSEIDSALAGNRNVILTAPPGSGKTTCVPPALIESAWLKHKKIVMLEPRRLAARNSAAYMAKRRGEDVGETIGYQVRLERRISKDTRLEVITEGLLAQRILNDPELADVGLIIFDEFHERSLQCDLAFALALDVRRGLRPDLRLMVMSATLDVDEVAAKLDDSQIIQASGRMFPVTTHYLGETSITAAIHLALKETDGDILCFLPGEGEIRKVQSDFPNALPLYGALSKSEQDRVFERSAERKLILSTSIAETSVTIEGITCVIDSGLMRVSRFSPASGMSGLVTLPLTQDRAEQRRGRAGRVRPGVCYRLWKEETHSSRAKHMLPEILEADLCSVVLSSIAWGAADGAALPWITPPPDSAWKQSVALLQSLGALSEDGRITEKGEAMVRLNMHPRLANMLLGGGDPLLAAILEEGAKDRETDIRYVRITSRMRELANRFATLVSRLGVTPLAKGSEGSSLALAYPDRIGRNRGNATFQMVSGRGASLSEDDPLANAPYLVGCALDDRQGNARIHLAAPITEAEILALFGEQVKERAICFWDRRNDCVKSVIRGQLGAMTLYERSCAMQDNLEAAMMEGIRIKGVDNMPCWSKEASQLRSRINFVASHLSEWPKIDEETLLQALPGFIGGMTRWKDLERLNMCAVMDYVLAAHNCDRRMLDNLAPVKMQVPSGSNMTIHYEKAAPTVEVRLQECFGLMSTPKVLNGTIPIVMTLLSPAQRPVQITKDLANFWKESYQLVRKDLRGRYPKHYWPEDPLTAVATRRVRPKA